MASQILISHGARATEDAVLERLRSLLAAAPEVGEALRRPLRLVVPSASLRDHLAARIVDDAGRPVAGLRVQTLFHLALEALERAARPRPADSLLFDVLVRRSARRQKALRELLDELHEGYGVVTGTVHDLLDAGFEEAHAEAMGELLGELTPFSGRAETARAQALLHTALATRRALDELGLEHRSGLLHRACRALERDPQRALPTRFLLIHGFADATGMVSDLLETLLRFFPSTCFIDRPDDPAEPGSWESAFTDRLVLRLGSHGPIGETADASHPPPPHLDGFSAEDPDCEAREVAYRIRDLLASGIPPERIAVVARELSEHGLVIRRWLSRLGVPFSGLAPGPAAPAYRQLSPLFELLQRGAAGRLERWLEAVERTPRSDRAYDQELRADLRLAFFTLGLRRLEDAPRHLADLELLARDGQVILPTRQGLSFSGSAEAAHAAHRRLDLTILESARSAAGELANELTAWLGDAAPRAWSEHRHRLRSLVDEHLGWSASSPALGLLSAGLAVLDRELPAELLLSRDELVLLLRRACQDGSRVALGGRGAGVQVMSAIEARSRTADHLFVIGLNGHAFPRNIREDPLLSDRLRGVLRALLPDLPIKASGYDEERYLFAQLLSSAPKVTLSWPCRSSDGRRLDLSPLVVRLSNRLPAFAPAPSRRGLTEDPAERPRPLAEELVASGLHGGREAWASVLPEVCAEIQSELWGDEPPPVSPTVLARARRAVVDELDPDTSRDGRRRAHLPGPYFGFVGRPRHGADPRRQPLYITTLENLAACPWQTFLRRQLRLTPPLDPLASLPHLRGLLVGKLVHRVLERLIREHLRGAASLPVPWPNDPRLETLLLAEARDLLAEAGLRLPGLARAASELARPYLEIARQEDWADGDPVVAGVEMDSSFTVSGENSPRRIGFKADRVDLRDHGSVLTDYKTGIAPTSLSRRALLAKVRAGEWLQLAAYAYVPSDAPSPTVKVGRLLFLRPDLENTARGVTAEADDPELREHFALTVASLLRLWDAGCFFPRLVEPDEDVEPPRCRTCEVAEACLRRDSGSRVRLRRFTESAGGEVQEIIRAVWDLRRQGEDAELPAST